MKPETRVGVIGFGYWGPNLVRNFFGHSRSTVSMVADLVDDNLKMAQKIYPAIPTTKSALELIESPRTDAVAIATPVASHFELAHAALLAGKHVLIEKPITQTSEQARELIALAKERDLILMVDHTFLYTGAVRKIRELIDEGELGDLYYFDTERINLGLLQKDVNVIWDLATHDLSILLYLIDERPNAVQAVGHRHYGEVDEIASLSLNYPSGFHAHLRVSWLSPVKIRLTLLGGSKKMVVFDDLEPSEKLRIYDKGIVVDLSDEDITTAKPIYRAGDVFIPKLDRTEALLVEAEHFLDCIQQGKTPISDGQAGLDVVRVLEAADRSLESSGQFVPL